MIEFDERISFALAHESEDDLDQTRRSFGNIRLTEITRSDYNSGVLCNGLQLHQVGGSQHAQYLQQSMVDSGKPLRIVLGWQVVATILLAVIGALLAGLHGAISAVLGGAVAIAGGSVFTFLARPHKARPQNPGEAWDGLGRILKAEGAKVAVIVILLWLVLATYKEVVMVGFIGTFIVAVIIFSMAVFLRNPARLDAGKQHVD